jgi:hypothetical protein
MKVTLLSDENLKKRIREISDCFGPDDLDPNDLADPHAFASNQSAELVALAVEVQEYRKIYGPLGCSWLATEDNDHSTRAYPVITQGARK